MASLQKLPAGVRFDIPRVRGGRFDVRADDGGAVIEIFDAIGGELVNASRIAAALRDLAGRPVTVKINSYGGDYFEGNAIYNLLRGHEPGVTVQVLGIAASAASVIAMAGQRIEIARSAEIMIHRAWVLAIGNVEVMQQAVAMLAQIDADLVGIYARRTRQKPARIETMMSEETFIRSDKAVELGFADALLPQDATAKLERVDAAAPADVRAFEKHLRENCGMSKSAAERVALAGWRALRADAPNPEIAELAARVQQQTAELRAMNQR